MATTVLAPEIDYTLQEFEELRQELINYAQSKFPGEKAWNDFLESNSGVVILEMFAFVGDALNFYLNRYANESFIDRVQSRKNMISLCALIGYRLATRKAASAIVRMTMAPQPNAVVIPLGQQFRNSSTGQIYEVINDTVNGRPAPLTIAPGTTSAEFTVKNFTSKTESFISPAMINTTIRLDGSPYLDEAVVNDDWTVSGLTQVTVNNVLWTQVDSFLNSNPTSLHYRISVADDGVATVIFGDGQYGAIPPKNSTITIRYYTGGGSIGNATIDAITDVVNFVQDINGSVVDVQVTNITPAEGGADEEDIEYARYAAPASLRAKTRTVCREDFIINSEEVSGVARAQALSINELSSIDENTVWVFLVPTVTDTTPPGTLASESLISKVTSHLTIDKPTTITLNLDVFPATYESIDVSADIYVKTGYSQYDIKLAIEKALSDYFDFSQRDVNGDYVIQFGDDVHPSQIIRVIQEVAGVDYLHLTNPVYDITLLPWQLPILGTTSFTFYGGSSSSSSTSSTSSSSTTSTSSTTTTSSSTSLPMD